LLVHAKSQAWLSAAKGPRGSAVCIGIESAKGRGCHCPVLSKLEKDRISPFLGSPVSPPDQDPPMVKMRPSDSVTCEW
jgi:hypothetical protein